jgi:transglutaminase-like putative cysteine protease
MNRIKSWVIRRFNLLNLLILALILATLSVVARGLADVARGLEPALLSDMALVGTLVGWTLAVIPMAGSLASLITLVFAISAVLLRIGRIGPDLLVLFQRLIDLGTSIWLWISEGQMPDWTPIVQALEKISASINVLVAREFDWLLAWAQSKPVFDPVAAALTWSLLLWAVSAWAGWTVRRHKQTLPAVIPAGVLLGATLGFTGSKPTALLWLLGISLPMMAIVSQEVREHRWLRTRINFSPTMWRNLVIWAALISLALVITAELTQSLSLNKIIKLTRMSTREEVDQRNQAAESLGLDHHPIWEPGLKGVPAKLTTPGLPRRHLIRSSPDLTKQEVMLIRLSDPAIPLSGLEADADAPRYYWRSNSYDDYTGNGWETRDFETVTYEAGQPIHSTDIESRRLVRQEVFLIAEESQMVYATGTLVTTNHGFTVDWRSPEDEFGALFAAPTKRSLVYSMVPDVGEEELRASGSDYPDWVRASYLTLPDTVPARVLALARDLTATAPSPYDRALAIESFLRDFTYTLDLPPPPLNRDVVDYFLFDLQMGYCDYYATSMVVLARAAGLPARIVIGYSSERYDQDMEVYVVTEAQAHSWVEIYFPEYGWIEFEPTAGRPPRERQGTDEEIEPTELDRLLDPGILESSEAIPEVPGQHENWQLVILISLVLLASGGIAWLAIDRWRLRRLPAAGVATEVFQKMRDHSRRLRIRTHNGDTPYEFSESLTKRLTRAAQDSRWKRALDPAALEVNFLVEKYVQISYSTIDPSDSDKPEIIKTWRWLRWRLWLAWLRERLRSRGWIR